MKEKIHPEYVDCKVTCGCGSSWMTRSTVAILAVEVYSNCHPFFTGQQKFVDTAGRIEKFNKKFKGFDTTGGEKQVAPEAAPAAPAS